MPSNFDMFAEPYESFSERNFSDCLQNQIVLPNRTLLELSGIKEIADPEYKSGLTKRVAEAWATPLNQLRCTQIRVLVGQKFGLKWLASPVAIFVTLYPQAECTFYPGDLTLNALRAHADLLQFAPEETKAMLRQDFSWMASVYDFDPDGLVFSDADNFLTQARKYAGLFH